MSLLGMRHGLMARGVVVTSVTPATGNDDAVSSHNGTSTFSLNQNSSWHHIQQHVDATLATITGYRFLIPATIAPGKITQAIMRIKFNNTGTFGSAALMMAELKPAAAWANTTTDRPANRYTKATVTDGVATVSWTPTVVSAGVYYPTSDIKTSVLNAMNDAAYVPGTSYVGVLIKAPLGSPVGLQAFSRDNATSTNWPILEITTVG